MISTVTNNMILSIKLEFEVYDFPPAGEEKLSLMMMSNFDPHPRAPHNPLNWNTFA